jgi:hypothetical protein
MKDFVKNPTVTYPRDTKDDTKIVSQKVTLSSEFLKNIESQNNFMECKSLAVRKKK